MSIAFASGNALNIYRSEWARSDYQRLLYVVESLRSDVAHPMILQFVSALPGDGTTTVASGFAQSAADEYDDNVLFVDCGALAIGRIECKAGLTGIYQNFQDGKPIEGAYAGVRGFTNLKWSALSSTCTPTLVGRSAQTIRDLFANMRSQTTSPIILDTPSLTSTPLSATMSSFCDGTILIVRAGVTSAHAVRRAVGQIHQAGGQVIGTVLNRPTRQFPTFFKRFL